MKFDTTSDYAQQESAWLSEPGEYHCLVRGIDLEPATREASQWMRSLQIASSLAASSESLVGRKVDITLWKTKAREQGRRQVCDQEDHSVLRGCLLAQAE